MRTFEHDIPHSLARSASAAAPDPTGEADRIRRIYAAQLRMDIAAISRLATSDDLRLEVAKWFPGYRDGYRDRTLAHLGALAQGTGGVLRLTELRDFRTRSLAAIRTLLADIERAVACARRGDVSAARRILASHRPAGALLEISPDLGNGPVRR
jgi:hypothetical protein